MAVRSFQQILDANNARKAALRVKLLGILDSGLAPDGMRLAYGCCRYQSQEGTCIVGALLDPAVRGRLTLDENVRLVSQLCLEGALAESDLGGLTVEEARTLQDIFDDGELAGVGGTQAALRVAINRMFPEEAA